MSDNHVITYEELVNFVLNNIKSRCDNVYDETKEARLGLGFNNGDSYNLCKNGSCRTTINVTDSVCKAVHFNVVKQQFTDFLISRGIYTKEGSSFTSVKGIMNFFNNVSSFMTTKLLLLSNETANNVVESRCFYVDTNSSFPDVNLPPTGVDFTSNDMSLTASQILKNICNTGNARSVYSNIQYISSSCSSSSCSSSSCSSSSSSYIVYMLLDK